MAIKDTPEQIARLLTGCGLKTFPLKVSGRSIPVDKVESLSEDKRLKDFIFDIEITPNRPDYLSIIGVARDISALTGVPLKYPVIKTIKDEGTAGIKVSIEDKNKCQRYTARCIKDIKTAASPDFIKRRLEAVGLRPINNIVDITNFVLMELGQPLHAFDYEKISGGEIEVRCARDKERIVLIGGIEKKLTSADIVIADKKGPVALAGIMGGEKTEVSDTTREILLESAHFDQLSVRRTTRRLGLESESSYRFERGVDIAGIACASDRAVQLFQEIAGGKISGEIIDEGTRAVEAKKIFLNPAKVNTILGTNITRKEIERILKSLFFEIKPHTPEKLEIKVPSFRRDVSSDIDLIEEVARIFGYEKIENTFPSAALAPPRVDIRRQIKKLVRQALVSRGASEIITYSLISKELESRFNKREKETIEVRNPLSQDQAVMRSSFLAGGLKVVSHNLRRGNNNLNLFELGQRYCRIGNYLKGNFPYDSTQAGTGTQRSCEAIAELTCKEGEALKEELTLALFLTGFCYDNWQETRQVDFFDLKGIVESLLEALGIAEYAFKKSVKEYLCRGESALLEVKGKHAGVLGRLKEGIADKFEMAAPVYVAEISLDVLLSFVNTDRAFKEIAKYPRVQRDIALVVKANVLSEEIVSVIAAPGAELVTEVRLFDVYRGEQIPAGMKSLAYSVAYRAADRTLTDAEVDKLHASICDKLKNAVGAEIRKR